RLQAALVAASTAIAPPPDLDSRPGRAVATLAQAAFWTSVLLLAYTNIGYPVLLAGWARLRPRPFQRGARQPSVTVVIAAHNEAPVIAARINNLLSSEYPGDRLEILLGLDGCTDATAEQARSSGSNALRVIDFETRRGKPAIL